MNKIMTLKIFPRFILGMIFASAGLSKLVGFEQMPEFTGAAEQFLQGLQAAGYFFPLLAVTQLVGGMLLFLNPTVPLGLAILAPIIVNILFFHLFLVPMSQAVLAFAIAGMSVVVTLQYKDRFKRLFIQSDANQGAVI